MNTIAAAHVRWLDYKFRMLFDKITEDRIIFISLNLNYITSEVIFEQTKTVFIRIYPQCCFFIWPPNAYSADSI